jgi:predicted kinase
MKNKSEIFIITGTPGSGKSTIAKRLLGRYEFGFHIPIDDLREWVVSGIAHPLPSWTDETTRQFELAYKAASHLAKLYANAGFAVAIDQVIYPNEVRKYFEAPLREHKIHKILLQPKVNVAIERNSSRTDKGFDTSILNETIQATYESLGEAVEGETDWIIIDSTTLNPDETVNEIFRRIKRAHK